MTVNELIDFLDNKAFLEAEVTTANNDNDLEDLPAECMEAMLRGLKEAFQQLYETAVQKEPDEDMQEHIFYAAEELKQTFIETARKHGIPVWDPTADNYNF